MGQRRVGSKPGGNDTTARPVRREDSRPARRRPGNIWRPGTESRSFARLGPAVPRGWRLRGSQGRAGDRTKEAHQEGCDVGKLSQDNQSNSAAIVQRRNPSSQVLNHSLLIRKSNYSKADSLMKIHFLVAGFPGLSSLVRKKVEDVDLEVFSQLKSGDILFIDSFATPSKSAET